MSERKVADSLRRARRRTAWLRLHQFGSARVGTSISPSTTPLVTDRAKLRRRFLE
jgi:hypothetical protein